MNWDEQIADCIEQESKRYLLKEVPVWLIASIDYEPDFIYFTEYVKLNIN